MMDPHSPVVVTVRDIWEELVKLRSAVEILLVRDTESRRDVDDHEARIRSLERARWPLPSLAVLVSIASLVLALLSAIR